MARRRARAQRDALRKGAARGCRGRAVRSRRRGESASAPLPQRAHVLLRDQHALRHRAAQRVIGPGDDIRRELRASSSRRPRRARRARRRTAASRATRSCARAPPRPSAARRPPPPAAERGAALGGWPAGSAAARVPPGDASRRSTRRPRAQRGVALTRRALALGGRLAPPPRARLLELVDSPLGGDRAQQSLAGRSGPPLRPHGASARRRRHSSRERRAPARRRRRPAWPAALGGAAVALLDRVGDLLPHRRSRLRPRPCAARPIAGTRPADPIFNFKEKQRAL